MKHNKLMRRAIANGKSEKTRAAPKPCAACAGSGRYDAKGNTKCGSCNGTGVCS